MKYLIQATWRPVPVTRTSYKTILDMWQYAVASVGRITMHHGAQTHPVKWLYLCMT